MRKFKQEIGDEVKLLLLQLICRRMAQQFDSTFAN